MALSCDFPYRLIVTILHIFLFLGCSVTNKKSYFSSYSPSSYMSYVTFDASLVPFFRYPFYGPQSQSYPDIKKIAYPKAGFPNPLVKVTIVDLEDKEKKTVHVKPPVEISSGEHYYSVRCLPYSL